MGAGPDALLRRGLAGRLLGDGHEVAVIPVEAPSNSWNAEVGTAFALAGEIAQHVARCRAERRLPFIVSGNCAPAAWGALAGLGGDATVCWFDAHGDFNTPETTITGFLDGMALAALTGRCWRPMMRELPGFRPVADHSVLLIGARALDPLEERALDESRIRRLRSAEVLSDLPAAVRLLSEHVPGTYIHLDLDVLEPSEAVANASAAPGGLSSDNLAAALQLIAAAVAVDAVALTAYDPSWDTTGRAAEIAIDLACAIVRTARYPVSL
jgi:arginase